LRRSLPFGVTAVTQTGPAAQSWFARLLSSRWYLRENLSPRASSLLVLTRALPQGLTQALLLASTQAFLPVVQQPVSARAP
jgi:hypothetical protein